jgi:hypothetical protein
MAATTSGGSRSCSSSSTSACSGDGRSPAALVPAAGASDASLASADAAQHPSHLQVFLTLRQCSPSRRGTNLSNLKGVMEMRIISSSGSWLHVYAPWPLCFKVATMD